MPKRMVGPGIHGKEGGAIISSGQLLSRTTYFDLQMYVRSWPSVHQDIK